MDHIRTSGPWYDPVGSDRMGDIVKKVGKNGKFLGWYIRYIDSDGRRKQRASHQPTQALARRMLVEIEARVARGMVGIAASATPSDLTVAELAERFLVEFASPRVKDLDRYRIAAQSSLNRILPHIGKLKASEVGRAQIERARNALVRAFRANTVRSSMGQLGAVLSWAARERILVANPMRGVALPSVERSTEYMGAEEAQRLLAEAARRARQGPLKWGSRSVALALALRLGLRRGEVFGLRWPDIDFAAGRITVAKSYRGKTKNGKVRHLPLPSALRPLLEEWKERCPITAEGVVCPVQCHGKWGMSSRCADHALAEIVQSAGCAPLARGWHTLRHTFASQFVMGGGSLVTLQKLLGHSTVEMTLIYSHLAPDFVAGELERVKY